MFIFFIYFYVVSGWRRERKKVSVRVGERQGKGEERDTSSEYAMFCEVLNTYSWKTALAVTQE